jgi:hypothetical protein
LVEIVVPAVALADKVTGLVQILDQGDLMRSVLNDD